MKVIVAILLIVAALPPILVANPQKPRSAVVISTEIGQIAGSESKVQLNYFLYIESAKDTGLVSIEEKDPHGLRMLLGLEQLQSCGQALQSAVDAALTDQAADFPYTGGQVSVTNGMLAPQIIIRPDDPGRGISRHAMSFDIDNAEQLVRLIDRALSNAEWISSRTEALKSTK